MTPAERTTKIAELRAEADRLEREGKRNWPEKVTIGMIFQHEDGEIYMASRAGEDSVAPPTPDCLVCVTDSWPRIGVMYADYSDDPFDGDEAQFTYLGHARDLLAIKTPDAPEPTGAELVGKVCEFSDDGKVWGCKDRCVAHRWYAGVDMEEYDGEHGGTYSYARLYREDRP